MVNKRSSSFGEFLDQIAKTYNVEDSRRYRVRIKGTSCQSVNELQKRKRVFRRNNWVSC